MTNVDNINADQVPYLIELLMDKGAKNVHVVNALTKKGRQEYIFFVDVSQEKAHLVSDLLASEIGTLGVRIINTEHLPNDYMMKSVNLSLKDDKGHRVWNGSVQVKIVKDHSGHPLSARVEYEDLKTTAQTLERAGYGMAFHEIKQAIENEVVNRLRKTNFSIEFDD